MALAPDASSASASKGLAAARKWVSLGADSDAIWGECQGSGKQPYQASIDLSEPAFKCTCPSRKFPCKHSLGLFLLFTTEPTALTQTVKPAWVSDWLHGRAERKDRKAETAKPADPAESAKKAVQASRRAEARTANVADGIDDLDRFLRDLIRGGLAGLPSKPLSFWDSSAARLVDAQAPGLARQVREVGSTINRGNGWQDRVLERLGRLYLLLDAFRNIERLPADLQAEVRSLIGFTVNQDDVLEQPAVFDAWQLVGQRIYDEERLRVRRSWFWGTSTGRLGLILEFAHAGQPFDANLVPGTIVDAELCFYPGAAPLRAAIKRCEAMMQPLLAMPGYFSLDEALESQVGTLQAMPWAEVFPFVLRQGRPFRHNGRWWLADSNDRALPMADTRDAGWRLFSLAGGAPLGWAGEWNGEELIPLGATFGGRYIVC